VENVAAGPFEVIIMKPTKSTRLPLTPLLTGADLQRLFRVTGRTIARWCASGLLPPPVKLGGQNRWTASALRQYIEGLN
jgi:hypothetical protein